MKTLYLLRHAKAEPGGKDVSDLDRPLSPRGHDACALIGAYLKRKRYIPHQVLSSPSLRTRQTVEGINEALGTSLPCQYERMLYLASAADILRCIQTQKADTTSVMLVGHNPGMHQAALLFASSRDTSLRCELELKYPTAALAVVQFDSATWHEVAPGTGELTDFVVPRELA